MRTQSTQRDHVFLLDRLRGTYVDAGEATRTDRILSRFSGGRVRIAPPRQEAEPEPTNGGSDAFEVGAAQRQARTVIGG